MNFCFQTQQYNKIIIMKSINHNFCSQKYWTWYSLVYEIIKPNEKFIVIYI